MKVARCPNCGKIHGKIERSGLLRCKSSNGKSSGERAFIFMEGDPIRVECCGQVITFNYSAQNVTVTDIYKFGNTYAM